MLPYLAEEDFPNVTKYKQLYFRIERHCMHPVGTFLAFNNWASTNSSPNFKEAQTMLLQANCIYVKKK